MKVCKVCENLSWPEETTAPAETTRRGVPLCRKHDEAVSRGEIILSLRDFDPHKYAINAGWGFDSVLATAAKGVADEDLGILTELAGGDEGLALDMAQELESWCKERVRERRELW